MKSSYCSLVMALLLLPHVLANAAYNISEILPSQNSTQLLEHQKSEHVLFVNHNVDQTFNNMKRSNNRFIANEIDDEIDVIEDKQAPLFCKLK